jgi:indole-3-glycerol phosphate synthase
MACVSESGIRMREDVLRMQDLGVDAVLVGETIVRSRDPDLKIKELLGKRK